ncbi:MAG: glyoxalase [Sphaerisporangium sp.]|nr:glyoxalase [Sphaerisporangium sp.]
MSVELNHTIVMARDRQVSADFMATILGLEVGPPFGPFLPVATSNDVTLYFANSDEDTITAQHYAFLVSEQEFDTIFERIQQAGITYYADPSLQHPGESNRRAGGRGTYCLDPDDPFPENLTRPYGSREE